MGYARIDPHMPSRTSPLGSKVFVSFCSTAARTARSYTIDADKGITSPSGGNSGQQHADRYASRACKSADKRTTNTSSKGEKALLYLTHSAAKRLRSGSVLPSNSCNGKENAECQGLGSTQNREISPNSAEYTVYARFQLVDGLHRGLVATLVVVRLTLNTAVSRRIADDAGEECN